MSYIFFKYDSSWLYNQRVWMGIIFWENKVVCPLFFESDESESMPLSHVQLFLTPWTIAHQAPLSMGFSRQEYWMGNHSLLQEIFPTQELNLDLLHCRQILYYLSHKGSPNTIKTIANISKVYVHIYVNVCICVNI